MQISDRSDRREGLKPASAVTALIRFLLDREQNNTPFNVMHNEYVLRSIAKNITSVVIPVIALKELVAFPLLREAIHLEAIKNIDLGDKTIGSLVLDNASGIGFIQNHDFLSGLGGGVELLISASTYAILTAFVVKTSGINKDDIKNAAKEAVNAFLHPKEAAKTIINYAQDVEKHISMTKKSGKNLIEQLPIISAVLEGGSKKEVLHNVVGEIGKALSWTASHALGIGAASDAVSETVKKAIKNPKDLKKREESPKFSDRFNSKNVKHSFVESLKYEIGKINPFQR